MITTQAGITNNSTVQASECIVSKASVQRIRDRRRSQGILVPNWRHPMMYPNTSIWCLYGCNSRALARASWRLAAALSYIRKPMNQNSWPSTETTWMYFSAGFILLTEGLAALSWWRGMTTCFAKWRKHIVNENNHQLFKFCQCWIPKWIKQPLSQKVQAS